MNRLKNSAQTSCKLGNPCMDNQDYAVSESEVHFPH